MSNQQAIIILGMHRSGTSALTRVLNLLGMELGQPLLPPHPTNETGFWEHATVVNLNEQLLHQVGSRWDDAQFLQKSQLWAQNLNQLRQLAAKTLYQNFATESLWGIKDPRLCRLLPFWLPILADTGCQLHFILMARHPLEVAASLQQRDDLNEEKSLNLWLTHVLSSEQQSRYHSRVFITYHELLTDWRATAQKIADNLKITWRNSPDEVENAVHKFLAPHLKHHDYQTKIFNNPLNLQYLQCENLYRHFQQTTFVATTDFTIFDTYYQQQQQPTPFVASQRIHLIVYLRKNQKDTVSLLQNTVQAFQLQEYQHCYLSIISPFLSPIPEFSSIGRLHWVYLEKTESINTVVEHEINLFRADWIALISAGDSFEPNLLSLCVEYIHFYPDWRLIYVDEDILTADGKLRAPHFKPAINLYLLCSMPYVGNFCLVQREILQQVGCYQFDYKLENDDICFKVIEQSGEAAIGHISQILYHCHEISTEPSDARPIIQQHLQRTQVLATVHLTDFKNIYRLNYPLLRYSLVSIIIATRNEPSTVQRCLLNIVKTTNYQHYEIIIVDNASDEPLELVFDKNYAVYKLQVPQEMSLSALYNQAVKHAHGEFLLFLNDDIEIQQANWLEQLLSLNQQPKVGIVGARLIDPQQHVLQAGYILGMGKIGIAGQIHQGLSVQELGYQGRAQAMQQLSAVSDNCMMIKKELYHQVNGMDEQHYAILFPEVDLCLKITQKGYKVVWTPFVTLQQNGVGSIIRQRQKLIHETILSHEITMMYQRWLPQLSDDRYYNRNLSLSDKIWCEETGLQPAWHGSENSEKSALPHAIPHIIAFSHDDQAVGEYRVRAPLRGLEASGLAKYVLLPTDGTKTVNLVELERMQGDILWLHNFLHNHQLNLLRQCWQFGHYFKIFGQDDLGYAISQFNPYYHSNYKDMKRRVYQVLQWCDRLIVTTEPLAEAYRHCSNDIAIIPNYIDFSRWQGIIPKHRPRKNKPRVGWAGAAQHLGDLQLIEPVVKNLAKYVDWIFFGMCPKALRPCLCEYHPMVTFDNYPTYLANLDLDLAIAPLENNAFNEAKSNLRLLEYGMMSYPVVCSDIYPYQNAPVTRVKNTTRAWCDAVLAHLHHPEWSKQQGAQLHQWVRQHYLLENHLNQWQSALNPSTRTKYRFEAATSQIHWVFILSTHIDAERSLQDLLNQHATVEQVSAMGIQSLQLSKNMKNIYLWTESPTGVKLREDEKNLEIIQQKQRWCRQFQQNSSVTTCIVSDIPASVARVRTLQQHFPNAYFIYLTTDVYTASLALYHQLQQLSLGEPRLRQRATLHCLQSELFFNAAKDQMQNLLEIAYEDLLDNPQVTLNKVVNFLDLAPHSFNFAKIDQNPVRYRTLLTAEQWALISTLGRSRVQ